MDDSIRFAKIQVMCNMTVQMKEALDAYAGKKNLFVAEVIRQGIAALIGYDLAKERAEKPAQGRKYASAEERVAAQKKREKDQRELNRALIATAQKGMKETGAKSLQEWLDMQAGKPNISAALPTQQAKKPVK